MNSPTNPDGRGWYRAGLTAGEGAWAISADTGQCAQEADANLAQADWKYASPNPINPALPVAECKYFLL